MKIEITDTAAPALRELARALGSPRLAMQAAGRNVEKTLHGHFDRKNDRGNRRNWWRSNFWSQVVKKATSYTGATDREATVTIASREFIHKLKGGVVRGKGKKLAIPLTSEAKRLGSPSHWTTKGDGQLVFRKSRRGAPLLFHKGVPFYVLVASVRHLADPDALPSDQAIAEGIEAGFRQEFADLL